MLLNQSVRHGLLQSRLFLIKSCRRCLSIVEEELEEKFIKGGGPGGQSINKTSNKVFLKHIPTGIYVTCQEHRDLSSNRKLARKLLFRKIEYLEKGKDSVIGKRIIKIQKRKIKRKKRCQKDSNDSYVLVNKQTSSSGFSCRKGCGACCTAPSQCEKYNVW